METTTIARRGWIEPVARAGYATKGVVYLLIGGLAVAAATGHGGAFGGEQAASQVSRAPYGEVLLFLVGIGLFAYALWRFVQALFDPEHRGRIARVGYAVSGVAHSFLGVTALELAMGEPGQRSQASFLGRVLASDAGPTVIGLAGAAVLLHAAYELHRAWHGKFIDEMKTHEMSAAELTWAVRIGRIGLAARSVVSILIGVGLVRAAIRIDPSRAETTGSALREIASQPFGMVLLSVVAIGLCAYGLHNFVEARYRRIPA
jgi:uncharacterized membrane protein YidH (DUF202 family)